MNLFNSPKRNLFLTALLSTYASNAVFFVILAWESVRALSCFLKPHILFALCFPKWTCCVGWQTWRQNQLLHSFSGWQCWTQKLFCCLSCHKVPPVSFRCSLTGVIDRKHNYIACALRDPQPLLCDWLCISKQYSTGRVDLYPEATETEKRPSTFVLGVREVTAHFLREFLWTECSWEVGAH